MGLALFFGIGPFTPVEAQFSNGFTFRRQIAFVDSRINGPQSNFPVLIDSTLPELRTTANGGKVEDPNGYDIIFTSDEGGSTRLAHEIESYDAATGHVVFWVRAASLGASTTIYLFYGHDGIATFQGDVSSNGVSGVWDDGYEGVWHLDDATGAPVVDSTVNSNHGTPQAGPPVAINGQIGGALDFDVGVAATRVAISPDPSLDVTLHNQWTMSAWVKPTSYVGVNWPTVYSYSVDATMGLAVRENTEGLIEHWQNDDKILHSDNPTTFGAWNHIAVVRDPTTTTFYLDGVFDGSGASVAINGAGQESWIGGNTIYPGVDDLLGVIDEVRFSSVPRSAAWLETEYNNQSSPGTFYSLGVETQAPSGPSACNTSVVADSWLEEPAPNATHGGDTRLQGQTQPDENRRPVYRFDLDGYLPGQPVFAAVAWLHVTDADPSGLPVEVRRITANWTESDASWNSLAGQFDPGTLHGTFDPSTAGWVSVDLTPLVQEWIDGTVPNQGIVLQPTSVGQRSRYASREWPTATERPCMELTAGPPPLADLSLTKIVNAPAPFVGDNVVFTLTVDNAGPNPTGGVEVTDLLPSGYAWVSDTGGGDYDPVTGLWNVGTVPVGGSAVLQITAQVSPGGDYDNVAEISAAMLTDPDSIPGNAPSGEDDEASVVVNPVPLIDLSLTKTADQSTPVEGGSVTFTVTVSNAPGLSDATNVQVRDLMSNGFVYSSDDGGGDFNPFSGIWNVGTVPAGGSAVLNIVAVVNQAGTHRNRAEVVAADQADRDSAPNNGTSAGEDDGVSIDLDPVPAPTCNVIVDQDTWLEEQVPNLKHGTDDELESRNHTGDRRRPMFRFDLSAIPPGSTVASATAWLRVKNHDNTGLPINVHRVTATWNESNATWNTTASDFDPAVVASFTTPNPGVFADLDLTALVQEWVDGTLPNNGIMLQSTAPVRTSKYVSREGGSVPERPCMNVVLISSDIDLSLTKSVDDSTPTVGGSVTFTLTVVNAPAHADATGVVVTDLLPSGYAYVSDDSAGSGTTYDDGTGAWLVGGVASGSAISLNVTATVLGSGSHVNEAEVTAADQTDADSTPGNGDPAEDDRATASTTPGALIDLSLTKTVDVANPAVGNNVVFTITVANATGLSDATGVEVTDLLPSGYAYVGDDSASSGTTYDDGTGVWIVGPVTAGGNVSLDLTATVLAAGDYVNEAEVSAAAQPDDDSTPGNGNPAEDDLATRGTIPNPSADLSLDLVVDDATPSIGATVVFSFAVTNDGPSGTASAEVDAPIPAGYLYVSDDGGGAFVPASGVWTMGPLGGGATATLDVTVQVQPAGDRVYEAEISASALGDPDSVPGNGDPAEDDQASASTTPGALIDLSLTKTVDVANPAVGSNVVFTITVANAPGLSDATGVEVTDLLPSGYAYQSDNSASSGTTYDDGTGVWLVGTVTAGGNVSLDVTATVLATGDYINEAEVTTADQTDADSTPGNGDPAEDDLASASTTPGALIDLSLTKTVDVANPAVGSNVVFTITVANAPGLSDATGVEVTDLLPSGYAYQSDNSASSGTTYDDGTGVWIVGTVTAGGNVSLDVTATVLAAGDYVNEAEVTAADQTDADSSPADGAGDDWSSAGVTPQAVIDFDLTKTVDDPNPLVGSDVVFTITVANVAGLSDATGVEVTDLLPSGYAYVDDDSASSSTSYDDATGVWTVGTVAAGSNVSLDVTATVLAAGDYVNEAEVTAADQTDADSSPADGAGDDWSSAGVTPQAVIDLDLTKTVDDPNPLVGSDVVFTITVANVAGLSDATGVEVTDLLPSGYAYVDDDSASSSTSYDDATGVWTVGTVAAGSNVSLDVTATVLSTGDHVNEAEVTAADQTDADSSPADGAGDDWSSAGVTPQAVIDLDLTKTVDDPNPIVGSDVVFTVTLRNATGVSAATNVLVRDPLPNGYAFVSAGGDGSYDASSGAWTLPGLPSGTNATLTVTATVLASGDHTNVAEVIAADQGDVDDTFDDGTGEDYDSASTTPVGVDGSVTITVTSLPGETLTITVTDSDLDVDPLNVETAQVTVTNATTGESETLTLNETGASTDVFAGTLPTVYAPTAGIDDDGLLTTRAGDTVTASYTDTMTSSGATQTFTANGAVAGGTDAVLAITPQIRPGEPLTVTVDDADRDTAPVTVDTLTATVRNTVTGESELLILTETTPSSGVFTGSLATALGAGPGTNDDGTLVVSVGHSLTASHLDPLDSSGGSSTVTAGSVVATSDLAVNKSVTFNEAAIGDVLGYVVRVENTLSEPSLGVVLQDLPAPGFKLVADSQRLVRAGPDGMLGTDDDVVLPIAIDGVRPMRFGPFDLRAGEAAEIGYAMQVGAGARQGVHENRATPYVGATAVGNTAIATVSITADIVFDQSTIIGKVYDDRNRSGQQDVGEAGVPNAMVVLDDGTYALTDEHGRFHFPALGEGHRMLKLNWRSLPAGAAVLGEASRIVSLTPGLSARVNFSVMTEDHELAIGRPEERGVQVTGTVDERPVQVIGGAEELSLLVNDKQLRLASSDVRIQVQQLDANVTLAGPNLSSPISFGLEAERADEVDAWQLQIFADDAPFRTLAGEGSPPPALQWDGRSDTGAMLSAGKVYEYQLRVEYPGEGLALSARNLFGVNREDVVSVQLTGEAFENDRHELSLVAREALQRVAEVLEELRDEPLVIEGHTDDRGREVHNLALSKRRAESARDYLVASLGFPAERITLRWYGEERPIASNAIEEGRALNRRVELRTQYEETARVQITDSFRAAARASVNGEEMTLGPGGRFVTQVPAGASLELEMQSSAGRAAGAVIELPRLELTPPGGESILAFGTEGSGCVAREEGGIAVRCEVVGRTQPGNTVSFDDMPVEVGLDGAFATALELGVGAQTYGVIVRTLDGFSHSANLSVEVRDDDDQGAPLILTEAIPNLSAKLPPEGTRLPGRNLPVSGTTEPGNTVEVNGEPVEVRADGGFDAVVALDTGAATVAIEVRDAAGRTGRIESAYEVPRNELFMLAFADAKVGMLQADSALEAAEDGELFTEGRIAFYLKGTIRGKYLVTASFDSGRGELGDVFKDLTGAQETALLANLDPDRIYPVYGDSSEVVFDAQSQGKLYLAVEGETMTALVGNFAMSLTDNELAAYQRTLYGARYAYQSVSRTRYGDPDTQVVVFGSEVRQAHISDELRATGGSLYFLSHRDIVMGSDQVQLVVRDKNTGLVLSRTRQRQNVDYTIKYPEGRLVFNRTVASVVPGGSLVDEELLSGNPVFVQVDYETRLSNFEQTAAGARARQQIGDHVAVGGTYVADDAQGGEYRLSGVDAEVRLGEGTRLVMEYAQSEGADALVYTSHDGGVTYEQNAVGGMQEGSAWKAALELDIGEWFDDPNRYTAQLYVREAEAGFFSNGTFQDQDSRKYGLRASARVTDHDSVLLAWDEAELRAGAVASPTPGGAVDATTASLQWEHRRKRWSATAEYFATETADALGVKLQDNTYVAARLEGRLNDNLGGRVEHQQTLSGPDNDQTTVGIQYQVLKSVALDAQATVGDRGNSAQAGAIVTVGDSTIYLTERQVTDVAGSKSATILGARSAIGSGSQVYSEYQRERGDAGDRAISLVGLQRQWDLSPGLRLVFSGERADVEAATESISRLALAAGVNWSHARRGIELQSRNEIRFDEGDTERRQFMTFAQLDYELGTDFTLTAKFRYSRTEDETTGIVEALLEEQSLGVAYRPARSDRFNALARFTRLNDLRPPSLRMDSNLDRDADVLSVETFFQVHPRLEWVTKTAARQQVQRLLYLPALDTRTWLAIQRLNLTVWKPIDIGVEYRILDQDTTSDRRQGFLGEATWGLMRHMRLGVGYNFTNFSDDEFTLNEYSTHGWFLRVQGRY